MSLCTEERRKCLGSTEGQSESKRWHVEHGGRIMALVCQIAITALLMIMPTLQRLPGMSCCVGSLAKYDARKGVKWSDPLQHGLH